MARDDEKRFDQAQFERVLRRAIDLEAEQGELLFSEHDLIAAAKELGVDEPTTRAAVRELYGSVELELEAPAGTDVIVEVEGGAMRVVAPPLKLDAGRLAHLVFLIGWLTFIAAWTWNVAQQNLLLSFLALPFWIIGGSALVASLRRVAEWTELQLLVDRGVLNRRMGPFLRSSAIDTRKLRVRARTAGDSKTKTGHLELECAGQRWQIMAERSPAEIEWIGSKLRVWLAA